MVKYFIRRRFWLCLITAVLGQHLVLAGGAQVKYTVTRLIPLSGVASEATAMNSQGDVVGNYIWRSDGANHIFLSHGGVLHDLGSFAGQEMTAVAINIYGRVAGTSHDPIDVQTAFTFFDQKLYRLNGGAGLDYAVGMNDAGHIVGGGGTGLTAWIWTKSGPTYLPNPAGTVFQPKAINNNEQVAGTLLTLDTPSRAVLYSNGVYRDLGTLPGRINNFAYALNDNGQVTGESALNGVSHAYLYTLGQMKDIHPAGLQNYGSAGLAINGIGQVVGFLTPSPNGAALPHRAFLYDGTGSADLNTLISPTSGWILQYATAINNAGQIVGYGTYNSETYSEAFLLTPLR